MTLKRVNVGLIGFGRWGQIRARAYNQNPNSKIIAISDVNKQQMNVVDSNGTTFVEKYGTKFYLDIDEMLEQESLDLIHVSVPANYHSPIALRCLEKCKNLSCIFIEKPLAASFSEAQKIVKTAEGKGVKLTVGYSERFSPAVVETFKLFNNNGMGKIMNMRSKRRGVLSTRVRDVGVTLDLGIHDIDLIMNFNKTKVVSVSSEAMSIISSDVEDIAMITLRFDNNVLGEIYLDRTYPGREREFEINASKATCKLITSDTNWANHYIMITDGFVDKVDGLNFKGLDDYMKKYEPKPARRIKPAILEEPATLEVNYVINSLINVSDLPVSPDEALESTKVALAALESQRKHRVVSLNH